MNQRSATVLLPLLVGLAVGCSSQPQTGDVVFSEGHETDPRDNGRPVKLIAAALGVEAQVFRDAFSRVTPAKNGHPSGELARRNKQVLMEALVPHGITNDRLDKVSNFYRYQPQRGGLWKHEPAEARALIENGRVVRVEITNPGFGYTTAPSVTIAGHPDVRLVAEIAFDEELRRNGRVVAVEVRE